MIEQLRQGGSREAASPGGEGLARQAKRYFPRAVVLVAALTLFGNIAPALPTIAIPLFLIAFSLVSTIGAMYHTVVRRMHRQLKYEEDGSLSHVNRRWTLRMLLFLIIFFTSGLFFLLEAPEWDFYEWAMTWAAIPLYFGTYAAVQHRLKKEYRPRFRKSHAIRWSFWIVGVLLCLVYAGISQSFMAPHYDTLAEAFAQAPNPFEHSPSALMGEAGWLTSFTDGVASFGLSQVDELSFVVGFACHFAVYAVVFFGLVNQFSFCLLSNAEIESEFQLLPAYEDQRVDDEPETPIRAWYVIVIALVSLVTIAGFLIANSKMEALRTTQEHTQLKAFVDYQKQLLIDMVDGVYEEYREQKALWEEYQQKVEGIEHERNEALGPLLTDYYARCSENIGSYLEWYDGATGQLARFLKPFGNPLASDAEKTFRERIAQGTNGNEIESMYREYQDQLAQLEAEYRSQAAEAYPAGQVTYSVNIYALDLWQPLSKGNAVNDVLLNTDGNLTREELEQKIRDLIDQAQQATENTLGINR